MRIACLQFAPQVGDVDNNLNRADAVLSRANPQDLNLLVLPELAFTGYNFHSLADISPFLEPTTSGITSLWARTTALKYNCVVTAGYPEKVDLSPKWPASPEYYNSAITVNADGETIANYRKSFLYCTDETWALEGPDGFYDGEIDGLGTVAMGICMDLNPYKFEAPWNTWEFANHVLLREVNLVVLSMAWMTREESRSFSRSPKDPDMETLSYWLARLEPLIRNEGEDEIIAVFANRTGYEENATYAGTSAVLGIQGGEVKVYGILGRGEKELLVVDTSVGPKMQLVSNPPRSNTPPAFTMDVRSPTSSTSSTNVSVGSGQSKLSITTGQTSMDPAKLDSCSFSPISPADSSSPRTYFGRRPIPLDQPAPEQKPIKERKPTPIPKARSESAPPAERLPTPVPVSSVYTRPASPKSRNCSRTRSRGTDSQHSPPPVLSSMLGNILSDEDRIRESPLLDSMSMIGKGIDEAFIVDDPDEIMYIVDEGSPSFGSNVMYPLQNAAKLTRTDFIARHIENQPGESSDKSLPVTIQARYEKLPPPPPDHPIPIRPALRPRVEEVVETETPSLSPAATSVVSSEGSDQNHLTAFQTAPVDDPPQESSSVATCETKNSLVFACAIASQFESSFTRNPLGPRSRHIAPRPLSTVW
ncbi:related to amino-terminal amidase [Rhynchosporium graminicola]|uniref:Related to amino-terminal amidase n=1 Tax=Rhynchosporium graminicola TaxID=2792576 RepID=A0A1E1LAN4_9HELO|nr:related to amino-terminal amidase [Rhynchosporium commune]